MRQVKLMKWMKYKKLIIFFSLVVLVGILNHVFNWGNFLKDGGNFAFLTKLAAEHRGAAVAVYMVLTVTGSVVFALPGVTFAVLAGLLFGPVLGTVCCVTAATLGAMAAFLAGRFFLKDSIRPLAMKNPYLKKWLFDESGKNELFVLMITRLVPVFPYNLQNFAYGVTDIRFSVYTVWSFLFMIPGTAMYTVGTAGLADPANRMKYLTAAAVIGAALTMTGIYLKKHYLTEGDTKAGTEPGVNQDQESVCIHCHLCRKNCAFLSKYQLDIGDTKQLWELAYHCFLCGRCTAVCPKGIDGRAVILEMRREKAAKKQSLAEPAVKLLLAEKKNYLFRNKRHLRSKTVLFPGCNFPSFYPETTKKLAKLLEEQAGIGVLYDCCGKPVSELGLMEDERRIISRLNRTLREAGVTELVMVCPNCYAFLRDKLDARLVTIYEKLTELGLGCKIPAEHCADLFLPCPDRMEKAWILGISCFMERPPKILEGTQCCGLGGCAGIKEPKLAAEMKTQMTGKKAAVYCASCAGNLTRGGGRDITHLLPVILESGERPDCAHSVTNRIKSKFW